MAQSESRQPSNIVWVVLAGILGMFALGGPKSSTENTPSATPKDSSGERMEGSQPVANGKDSLDPLDDFFALDSEQRHPFSKNKGREQLDGYKWKYLIVTVPDPVDTQFGFAFDQLLDSTQRALETQGWVLDRAWLPWETDKGRSVQRKRVATWTDLPWVLEDKVEDKSAGNQHAEDPGVLLFRHLPPPKLATTSTEESQAQKMDNELLIVLLVGEKPMSGIHKRAFSRALRLMWEHPAQNDTGKVRVVGPYFTGSQSSLRLAMLEQLWGRPVCAASTMGLLASSQTTGHLLAASSQTPSPQPPDLTFQVISGAATGVDRDLFCSTLDGGNHPRICFQATVIPVEHVLDATLFYLDQREKSKSGEKDFNVSEKLKKELALLVESNTGYGKSLSVSREGPSPQDKDNSILKLLFPLHIAGLRVQYEQTQRRKEEQMGLSSLDALVPRLGLRSSPDRSTIPSQDPETTSSLNGEVLKDLLSIIARRQKRYVGIIASDPRDQVFLASALRERCPDVQVFLLDNDQIFTLPEYAYYMKGTIIGSTYSLIPENQRWTDRMQRDKVCFPSQSAQGHYNAILAQMDDGTGRAANDMIEYWPPSFQDANITPRPPVWITMIGQNGDPVPLQFFTELGSKFESYVWPEPNYPQQNVKKMQMAFPATTLLALIVVLSLAGFVIFWAFSPTPLLFWLMSDPDREHFFGEAFGYRFFALTSLIALLLPVIGLSWIADKVYAEAGEWPVAEAVFFWLTPPALFLLLLTLFAPLCSRCYPGKAGSKAKQSKILCFLQKYLKWILNVAFVLALLAVYIYMRSRYIQEALSSWQAMFFERALNLMTGVSPLFPLALVCLMLFLWSYYQLRRMHLADGFAVDNPFPLSPVGGYPFDDLTKLHNILRDESRSSRAFIRNNWWQLLLVMAIVVLGAWLIFYHYVPTAEGFLCSWFFFLTFALGFFLIALNLLRFWQLWSRLKKLLGQITLLPMLRAFDRMPQKVTLAFGGYLSAKRAHLNEMHLPYHQLYLLREETQRLLKDPSALPKDSPHNPTLKGIDKELQESKVEAEKAFSLGSSAQDDHGKKLKNKFSELTVSLLKALTKFWPEHSFKDAFGANEPEPSEPKEPPNPSGATNNEPAWRHWVELAEDLVAMQVYLSLRPFFLQMRNLIWSMIVCGTLLLLGSTSYPFQPERLLLLLFMSLIIAVLACFVWVLVQLNRDELLSRISRTPPNHFSLDWDFVSSIFTYVIPMGTIVVLQMSGAFRFLLEPVVRILR